jgi:hypothetical protein
MERRRWANSHRCLRFAVAPRRVADRKRSLRWGHGGIDATSGAGGTGTIWPSQSEA